MLAYVFWHQPDPGVAPEDYERALEGFHRSLAAEPPEGFRQSLWHRFEALPWLGGEPGYEDWYLVDGWREVGALESGAVTGSRRAPHDGVAMAAMLRDTVPDGAAVWRRRLVLGPAPENCVAGSPSASLPASLNAVEVAGAGPSTE